MRPDGGSLPGWFPTWAKRLGELSMSGSTSVFLLHGNTFDFVPLGARPDAGYGSVAQFLAEQMFGRYDLVLHYDLGRGLRAFAGRDETRLREMVTLANKEIAGFSEIKNDPGQVLAKLDQYVRTTIVSPDDRRKSLALIIDQASYLFPDGEPGRMSFQGSALLVTLLNWAQSPHLKRLNMAFVLIDERLTDLSGRLASNPHVASLEVPLPEVDQRKSYIEAVVADRSVASFSDYSVDELARLTAGITLADIGVLLQTARESARLDQKVFRDLKKRLIERHCQGLLEFVEPKWGLDIVIGHEPVKRRLAEDATLLKQGALDTLPMGYLICGPVGTGKTFLAQCTAGAIGAPCVTLKNFRSKYVGETEGNLERVLSVLRAMGPVMVIVDEADAALGDRDADGDSGTSSRVFGMIATQMGDTRYRGKILWMLLTARPDLLPIDLKRQGRAEVHIPLFYPHEESELKAMFVAMARKLGTTLDVANVPPIADVGKLSGADVEGIVGRAWRASLIAGEKTVTRAALEAVLADFLP
ncbi:MAG: ATP-binding protein, partial [Gemmatimonadetes bacterium]|nr:ATP-binding protein [Gemmatimonadota bacterium]